MPRKARKHVKKVSKTDEVPVEKVADVEESLPDDAKKVDVKEPKKTDKKDEFSKCLAEFKKFGIAIDENYLKSYIKAKGIDSAAVLLNNTKKLRNIK